MQIYNTLTRKKEDFKPIKEGKIGIYLCGPTVYDFGHLGHARSAVAFDIIRRYLLYKNYTVTFVSNYTDVDDKMINRARERGISVKELAESIIPEYVKDYAALGIMPPDKTPRATEFIPQIIDIVSRLLEKDFAYCTEDGVYFEVRKFRDYGKLSGQKLDELIAGARVEINELKRNPEDFALWKKEKPGEPAWDSPFGRGRPGWHIECSAMSATLLTQPFDIHGGGQDLIFPHHESEIAQSEAAFGKQFCRYWMHNGFVKINQEKMSKSLGNFFTIKEVLEKWNPKVVRCFLLSTHYRMPIDYSEDLLLQARSSLNRLQDFWRVIHRMSPPMPAKGNTPFPSEDLAGNSPLFGFHSKAKPLIEKFQHDFESAMNEDFEITVALRAVFELMHEINTMLNKGIFTPEEIGVIACVLERTDSVLNVMKPDDAISDPEIEKLVAERNKAREEKNFKRSDEIREILQKKGIVLEDTAGGTVWKKML